MKMLTRQLTGYQTAARRRIVHTILELALAMSDAEDRRSAAAARRASSLAAARAMLTGSPAQQQRPTLRVIQGGLR